MIRKLGVLACGLVAGPAFAREPEKAAAALYADAGLARYGFPPGHPLGADRQGLDIASIDAPCGSAVDKPPAAGSDKPVTRGDNPE